MEETYLRIYEKNGKIEIDVRSGDWDFEKQVEIRSKLIIAIYNLERLWRDNKKLPS